MSQSPIPTTGRDSSESPTKRRRLDAPDENPDEKEPEMLGVTMDEIEQELRSAPEAPGRAATAATETPSADPKPERQQQPSPARPGEDGKLSALERAKLDGDLDVPLDDFSLPPASRSGSQIDLDAACEKFLKDWQLRDPLQNDIVHWRDANIELKPWGDRKVFVTPGRGKYIMLPPSQLFSAEHLLRNSMGHYGSLGDAKFCANLKISDPHSFKDAIRTVTLSTKPIMQPGAKGSTLITKSSDGKESDAWAAFMDRTKQINRDTVEFFKKNDPETLKTFVDNIVASMLVPDGLSEDEEDAWKIQQEAKVMASLDRYIHWPFKRIKNKKTGVKSDFRVVNCKRGLFIDARVWFKGKVPKLTDVFDDARFSHLKSWFAQDKRLEKIYNDTGLIYTHVTYRTSANSKLEIPYDQYKLPSFGGVGMMICKIRVTLTAKFFGFKFEPIAYISVIPGKSGGNSLESMIEGDMPDLDFALAPDFSSPYPLITEA